jgi:hypothetical protein
MAFGNEKGSGGAKAPHTAIIKMEISVYPVLETGELHPGSLSEEDLSKFGITNKAVMRVDGFDRFDCVKNIISLFQDISPDNLVEGIKDGQK